MEIREWGGGTEVFQEVVFPWGIGPRGAGYRFDIVVPALKLIVEYDSSLHDSFNKHFHINKARFMAYQMRDQIKDKLAKRMGWRLFRVRENDPEGGLDVRRWIEGKI